MPNKGATIRQDMECAECPKAGFTHDISHHIIGAWSMMYIPKYKEETDPVKKSHIRELLIWQCGFENVSHDDVFKHFGI